MSTKKLILTSVVSAIGSVVGTAALLTILISCSHVELSCPHGEDIRIGVKNNTFVGHCLTKDELPSVSLQGGHVYGCGKEPSPIILPPAPK